jgi:hypothetical protein
MDTNVLEEYIESIFRIEVSQVMENTVANQIHEGCLEKYATALFILLVKKCIIHLVTKFIITDVPSMFKYCST